MKTVEQLAPRQRPFAHDNVVYLLQALDLLAELDDDDYVRCLTPMFENPIGAHLRHVVDHYSCFLDGLANGRIDYDNRSRDPAIETDRALAAEAIRAIIQQLESITDVNSNRDLQVRIDCGGGPQEAEIWSQTSIERELQFLVSHTVHHYALVAVMLRLEDRSPAADFGVSPSTLQYRATTR